MGENSTSAWVSESPLSQGRELKYLLIVGHLAAAGSPLSQGRELKSSPGRIPPRPAGSPLSQGRELKYVLLDEVHHFHNRRPSRRGVN